MKIILGLFLCLGFVCRSFAAPPVLKAANREISGTVTDKRSKFVTGEKVTLISLQTKKRLQSKTDRSGFFKFTNLAFGKYRLKFSGRNEYLPQTSDVIELGLNGAIGYNVTLESRHANR